MKKIPARGYIEERINTATHLKWSLYNSNVGPYAFDNRFVENGLKNKHIFHRTDWNFIDFGSFLLCSTPVCVVNSENLGQFGIYNLTINGTDCTFHTHQKPVNTPLCKY